MYFGDFEILGNLTQNFVALLESSWFYCELKQNQLNISTVAGWVRWQKSWTAFLYFQGPLYGLSIDTFGFSISKGVLEIMWLMRNETYNL